MLPPVLPTRRRGHFGFRQVLASLAMLLLLFSSVGGCGAGQSQQQLQLGADHFAKGEYSLAQEHYSQALQLNPRSAPAYLGRGQVNEKLGSPAAAADDYKNALELQPDLTEARERLVQVLVETGNGQQALDQISAVQPSRLTPLLLLARGRARLQVEQASAAAADFDNVLKLEPKSLSAHYYRGLARSKLGQLAEAEQDFTTTISRDASNASAYWQRGLVRDRRGMKELAHSDRQKAAELDPRMGFSESQLGKSMIEKLTGKKGDDAELELFSKEAR